MWLWRKFHSVTQTFFELFSLNENFNIELDVLEHNYRKIQAEVHPDRFVTASATEKLKSMQLATLANEGFKTLKNPANRAKYILELHGIIAISESNTAMPTEFLMQQMEWREVLEDGTTNKSICILNDLLAEIKKEINILQRSLINLIDINKDYIAATDVTRKLIFMDKVSDDIKKSIDNID